MPRVFAAFTGFWPTVPCSAEPPPVPVSPADDAPTTAYLRTHCPTDSPLLPGRVRCARAARVVRASRLQYENPARKWNRQRRRRGGGERPAERQRRHTKWDGV